MNCNHDNASTPFCPFCGVELQEPGPSETLLRHMDRTIKLRTSNERNLVYRLENYEYFQGGNYSRARDEKDLAKVRIVLKRWKAWRTWVADMMALEKMHGRDQAGGVTLTEALR